MYYFIIGLFDNLAMGNASVITSENIYKLNQEALRLYNKSELDEQEISELQHILMSCNILYNRTDMDMLPIEDGVYDLLLEKYKKYDENFQVGSAIVEFQNLKETNLQNPQKVAIKPIMFNKPINRDELHQDVYDKIIRKGEPILNKHDFAIRPIEFTQDYITKRKHNTEHNHPDLVGSLDKAKFVFNKDAIDAKAFNDPNVKILERDFFQDHIKNGIINPNQIIDIVAELKYDGVSVEGDCGLELISARTRGDTGIGEASDITPILQGYTFKQAKCMIGEKPIGVKFEAIMTNSNLQKFNQLRNKDYKNCRTAIIGLFGASDAYLFRDLITLVPLAIDRNDVPMIENRMQEIEFINKVFVSHGEPLRYCYFSGTVSEVLYMIKVFWDEAKIARNYLNFMFDGIVVSYLDENIRKTLGRKNYINKYSMAVKFDPLEKQTIFRGYTYEVGQHGTITPMIHYDPVEFIGTIHTKSTGSSLERFNELSLKYGDIINVKYVNDVMPYVSKLDCEANRNNTNPIIQFPTRCPICDGQLITSSSSKTAICVNEDCPGRSVKRMTNMLAKLNIKGFAESSITSLGKTHFYELRYLDKDYYINKLGEANGSKLFEEMKFNKPIKDYIFMGALGFTSIAHKKWQGILKQITIRDLYNLYTNSKSEEEFICRILSNISNPGEITVRTIAREFPFFEKDILEAIAMGPKIIDSFGIITEAKKQIRFTGVRNSQLCEQLCNAGYDADDSSSVTKKTDILLVPYEGFSSTKTTKAPDTCLIIPIDKFISNMDFYLTSNGGF